MKPRRFKSLPLLVFLLVFPFLLQSAVFSQTKTKQPTQTQTTKQDTTKKDTTKHVPGYYEGVDVKLIYPWIPDEPQWYRNVCCQVVKKGKKITELNIFLKTCTEQVEIKKGYIRFEILDHKTKKLLVKGP